MELFKVDTLDEAESKLLNYLPNIKIGEEEVFLLNALGRILSEDIYATEDIPAFTRSVVDGYAVLAKDLFGASESLPVFLEVIGKVDMGKSTDLEIKSGHAVYVPTGGMLPKNADAVVMIEYVELLNETTIGVYNTLAPNNNTMQKGEDIKKENIVLEKGSKIRTQDIGVLSALGIINIKVKNKAKITIFSTGDEIIAPNQKPKIGEIRDINSYVVAAMCEEAGAIVVEQSIIKDDYETLKTKTREAMKNSDLVILSGGSSVGEKDFTSTVIKEMGTPGVITHGLAIKPGKPTIIGVVDNTIFIGLPGQPASAYIVFLALVKPIIELLLEKKEVIKIPIKAIIDGNVHATAGRKNYQMVDIYESNNVLYAKPIHGKSGTITLLSKAKGYTIIESDLEGVTKGSCIDVYLF